MESYIQALSSKACTPPAYALYCYEVDDCRITAYQSGKLLIQGQQAETVAAYFKLLKLHQIIIQINYILKLEVMKLEQGIILDLSLCVLVL